jgi:hypothetical protein
LVISVTTIKKDMKLTYIAKRLIFSAVAILSLSSCQKENINVNQGGTTITTGTTVKVNEDESLRKITINIPAQVVKTFVNENVLTLVYTEDLSAVLDPKGFDLSYSIRLNENFSFSALSRFSYTVPAPNGSYTTDWAGNDLKVLNEVTRTDVNVEGKAMVKLQLTRNFTFTKRYATAQEAINQQNTLLASKTDVVKFTSYVVFGKEYPATTLSALLVYTK